MRPSETAGHMNRKRSNTQGQSVLLIAFSEVTSNVSSASVVSQTSKFSWQRRRKVSQHCFCFQPTVSQGINSSWKSGEIHFRESISYYVKWVFSLWLKYIIQSFILVWNVLEKISATKKNPLLFKRLKEFYTNKIQSRLLKPQLDEHSEYNWEVATIYLR